MHGETVKNILLRVTNNFSGGGGHQEFKFKNVQTLFFDTL